ncbi:MAG TPA: DUF167 domain-containing protein [Syntrophomonadaceae bacterium]|nr:DUF167 domain-containing protein [Syntrophomonadaceae bacterium]
MLKVTETKEGVRLEIKVQPRSSRNQMAGVQDGILKIKLTAPPVDGEANLALIEYLSSLLGVPKRSINLIKGETSRNKLVEINGIKREFLLNKVGNIN